MRNEKHAKKNAEWGSPPSTILRFSFPVLYSSFSFRPRAPSLALPRSTGGGNYSRLRVNRNEPHSSGRNSDRRRRLPCLIGLPLDRLARHPFLRSFHLERR